MPSPALESAWQRLKTSAEKVIDAGDKLDDAGGLRRLAAPWTRAEKTKARAVILEAMQVLKGQLAMLNSGPPEAGPRSLAEPPRRPAPTSQPLE